MKILFYCLCMLGSLTCLTALENDAERTLSEKIYIDPSDVYFSEKIIMIHLKDDLWAQANTVHVDGAGLYISSFIPVNEWGKWVCEVCGKRNSRIRSVCKECGAYRYPQGD